MESAGLAKIAAAKRETACCHAIADPQSATRTLLNATGVTREHEHPARRVREKGHTREHARRAQDRGRGPAHGPLRVRTHRDGERLLRPTEGRLGTRDGELTKRHPGDVELARAEWAAADPAVVARQPQPERNRVADED